MNMLRLRLERLCKLRRHVTVEDRAELLHEVLDVLIEVLQGLLARCNVLRRGLLLRWRKLGLYELLVMKVEVMLGVHWEARLGWSMLLRLHGML
jgi:hypothetical protein